MPICICAYSIFSDEYLIVICAKSDLVDRFRTCFMFVASNYVHFFSSGHFL